LALANVCCRSRKRAADGSQPNLISDDRWPSERKITQSGGAPGLSPTTVAAWPQVRTAALVAQP
jgi:hypothetical protein